MTLPSVRAHRGGFVFDNMPSNTNRIDDGDDDASPGNDPNDDNHSVAPSVDTTQLASSVGSVVGPSKSAFLRSVVFQVDEPHDLSWDVVFADGETSNRRKNKSKGLFKKAARSVVVDRISGHLKLSKIEVGDVVTNINGKRIGSSYNASRCMNLLTMVNPSLNFISIQTGNDNGLDTIIQVTIIKPRPDMTAEDLGLTVWWWRSLCVRNIEPNSMFGKTPVKIDDELHSINDIIVDNNTIETESFNRLVLELPCEVTLVIKRGKQRWTGRFG